MTLKLFGSFEGRGEEVDLKNQEVEGFGFGFGFGLKS